jgi:hypothetical protein
MESALTGGGLILTERVIFLVLLFSAGGMAVRTVIRRFAMVRSGRPELDSLEDQSSRFKRLLRYVPGQWCNIQNISARDIGGVQHLFLFFGALFLSVYYGVFIVLGEGFGLSNYFYKNVAARNFVSVSEVFAVLILIALAWGLARRTITKPARLGPDFETGTFLIITLGGYVLMLCFLCLEALRVHLGMVPFAGIISGLLVDPCKQMFQSTGQMSWIYHLLWWIQASLSCRLYRLRSFFQASACAVFPLQYFRQFPPAQRTNRRDHPGSSLRWRRAAEGPELKTIAGTLRLHSVRTVSGCLSGPGHGKAAFPQKNQPGSEKMDGLQRPYSGPLGKP